MYLDKVVENYKEEADESLHSEFVQWLEGVHTVNQIPEEYVNAEGKPVRRWVMRTKEAEDAEGGYKVGQARVGWKHTPWGRAQLTHLPGVRDFLRNQKEAAARKDLEMQLLAEYGPQSLEQAWEYFKHWVKARPVSDTVALPEAVTQPQRSDFGPQMPQRYHAYDPDPQDRQPAVLATDQFEPAETYEATDEELKDVRDVRQLRERMEALLAYTDMPVDATAEEAITRKDAQAQRDDAELAVEEIDAADREVEDQRRRHLHQTAS